MSRLEKTLRRVLLGEAVKVQPPYALDRIRARTSRSESGAANT